jgi:meso-butanediol dehydrogenase/(S,S)-butanediol dehydrogenase/diacetyl reductase
LGCRKVARQMIEQGEGGRIINIASQAGKTGFPRLAPYCASKGAVLAFTRALALELVKYGILVNSICPGTVDTPLIRENTLKLAEQRGIPFEKLWDSYLRQIPIGRFESPDDVAKVVLFLASEGAAYITGQAINVTGGMEMH